MTQRIAPAWPEQIHKRLHLVLKGESRSFNQLGFPKSWSFFGKSDGKMMGNDGKMMGHVGEIRT